MSEENSAIGGLFIGSVITCLAMLIFSDRIVTPDEISRSEKICERANSELVWFEINSVEIEVHCKSGAMFTLAVDSSKGQDDSDIKAEPTKNEVNTNE